MTQPPYGGGYPAPQPQYAPQGYPQQPPQYAQPPQQGGYPAPTQPAAPQAAMPSLDDFFSGGGSGAPSFDFQGVNHGLIGTIVHQQMRQRTEIGDSTKKLWNADGTPQVQLEVTLQTDLRNWQWVKTVPTTIDERGNKVPLPPEADTGLRRIYVWYKMRDAVTAAVARAGAKHTEIGGTLGVKQSGTEPNPKGKEPIRVYEAVYTPPAPQADAATAAFFGGQQQAPQYAPQQPAPQAPGPDAFAQPIPPGQSVNPPF